MAIGIFIGLMFAMPVIVVALARNDGREQQALLSNALSWTVGDLNSRLNDADFRIGRVLENPQNADHLDDAELSVSGAAGVLQNVMAGLPLEPEYSDKWQDMAQALFRSSNELGQMRTEVNNNQELSEQSIARLREMRELVEAIRSPLASSEIRGEQGVSFNEIAVEGAAQAAIAF